MKHVEYELDLLSLEVVDYKDGTEGCSILEKSP